MESDAEEQLRIIERAEAAQYVSYPKTPWWAMPFPGRGRPPREIGRIWRGYFVGVAAVAVIVAAVWWLAGVPAAAPTAFVLVTAGLWYYERRYAVAAAQVRERLG